jgi:hypothetical protein
MHINGIQLNVLVKGRPVEEFQSPMDFQTYIEGRDGSDFEVQIVNPHPYDIEAIISIDGLSITDGKAAGSASQGYLIRARETMTIPGWKVDGTTAAKFVFGGSTGGSYVEQSGGDAANKGVIGLKAFAPKYKPRPAPVYRGGYGEHTKGVLGGAAVLRSRGSRESFGSGPSGMSPSASFSTSDASFSSATTTSYNAAVGGAASFSTDSLPLGNSISGSSADNAVTQTLGTEFGAATEFKTTQVDFERGDLQGMLELFYDDRQGLKRRGIDVSRTTPRPSAFPADEKGCTPPPGWNK